MSTLAAIGQHIKLHDGRVLGYAEYGDLKGKPIFHFHGANSSRLSGRDLDLAATKLNARIIVAERPGFGLSDFKPGRQILDWSDDVSELADALQLDRFAVMGLSAGSPYVLACALKIPQRLTAAAIVSGDGPHGVLGTNDGMLYSMRLVSTLCRRAPWLLRMFVGLTDHTARHYPNRFFSYLTARLAEPDKALLARPEIRQNYIANFIESHRYGTRGAVWDMVLISRPWELQLQDIAIKVYLWHGGADTASSPAMGRYIAHAIPNCQAKFYPGEGHLSLLINRLEEILSFLVS